MELALKSGPKSSTAHAFLGTIHDIHDGDLVGADRELKLARALAPNDADVLFQSSGVSGHMGHSDEALNFLNASMERNPLFPGTYLRLGIGQLGTGSIVGGGNPPCAVYLSLSLHTPTCTTRCAVRFSLAVNLKQPLRNIRRNQSMPFASAAPRWPISRWGAGPTPMRRSRKWSRV